MVELALAFALGVAIGWIVRPRVNQVTLENVHLRLDNARLDPRVCDLPLAGKPTHPNDAPDCRTRASGPAGEAQGGATVPGT